MKTDYIFNPFHPTPANLKSHVRGWDMHWADTMSAEIATKDTDLTKAGILYLSHGVNFSGGLNLFGGVSPEIYGRLEQLCNFEGELVSLDMDMPDYANQLEKRIGQATCDKRLEALLPRLRERFEDSTRFTQLDVAREELVIGDSHATAYAPKNAAVARFNGKTLHGALKEGLIQEVLASYCTVPKRLTLVFGSVDIRHHIFRQDNPMQALSLLCDAYSMTAREIADDYCIEVEVAMPVPVEYEGRKLPQTGWYKGTPFAGSREQRLMATRKFKDLMEEELVVAHPPLEWYDMDGEVYAKTIMELGSSVHIAPTHYRKFGQWPR